MPFASEEGAHPFKIPNFSDFTSSANTPNPIDAELTNREFNLLNTADPLITRSLIQDIPSITNGRTFDLGGNSLLILASDIPFTRVSISVKSDGSHGITIYPLESDINSSFYLCLESGAVMSPYTRSPLFFALATRNDRIVLAEKSIDLPTNVIQPFLDTLSSAILKTVTTSIASSLQTASPTLTPISSTQSTLLPLPDSSSGGMSQIPSATSEEENADLAPINEFITQFVAELGNSASTIEVKKQAIQTFCSLAPHYCPSDVTV